MSDSVQSLEQLPDGVGQENTNGRCHGLTTGQQVPPAATKNTLCGLAMPFYRKEAVKFHFETEPSLAVPKDALPVLVRAATVMLLALLAGAIVLSIKKYQEPVPAVVASRVINDGRGKQYLLIIPASRMDEVPIDKPVSAKFPGQEVQLRVSQPFVVKPAYQIQNEFRLDFVRVEELDNSLALAPLRLHGLSGNAAAQPILLEVEPQRLIDFLRGKRK